MINNSIVLKKLVLFAVLIMLTFSGKSQEGYKQTIRGTVYDKQSQQILVGASVYIPNSTPQVGTVSDEKGNFRLENLPIGRHTIQISFLGYNTITLNDLLIRPGKELVLKIELEESVLSTGEVVVKGYSRKDQALNEMTTVSARSFTIEETNRYAGSLGDPSRMASNYAGVITLSDNRNDIIIRGNSPIGLLWRLDGIEIPNPSHFGAPGTSGGPITILNNNLLTNSDFLTGAFPADYGNTITGAFDLKMRSGNNERREYWAQIGWNGLELGAEGPFSKNSQASYLINYRYSAMAAFKAVGIDVGLLISNYQDLSFKVSLPTKTFGKFDVFGIGGLSSIKLADSEKDQSDWTFKDSGENLTDKSKLGVLGLSHLYFLTKKSRLKTNFSVIGSYVKTTIDTFSVIYPNFFQKLREESSEMKYTLSSHLTTKFNAKNTLTSGFYYDVYDLFYKDSLYHRGVYEKDVNIDNQLDLIRVYSQLQHKFSEKASITGGVNYQLLTYNNSYSLEPRLGFRWNVRGNQSLNLGLGMHSQVQPRMIYFVQTELPDKKIIQTNNNLDFTRSNHFVLGYDYLLNENLRLKAELYYQYLYDIPVKESLSAYSLVNSGTDFYIKREDSLVNKGTGRNYGIELTFERFFAKNYYFLITASVFESKYSGYDGIERSTAFNGNYVVNALGGYEKKIGKYNSLVFGLKSTLAGGKPYISFDKSKTLENGEVCYDWNNAYEKRYNDYMRLDIRLGLKRNKSKLNIEYSLDLQNITNRKNIFIERISLSTGETKKIYQMGFYPMVTWRIQF